MSFLIKFIFICLSPLSFFFLQNNIMLITSLLNLLLSLKNKSNMSEVKRMKLRNFFLVYPQNSTSLRKLYNIIKHFPTGGYYACFQCNWGSLWHMLKLVLNSSSGNHLSVYTPQSPSLFLSNRQPLRQRKTAARTWLSPLTCLWQTEDNIST